MFVFLVTLLQFLAGVEYEVTVSPSGQVLNFYFKGTDPLDEVRVSFFEIDKEVKVYLLDQDDGQWRTKVVAGYATIAQEFGAFCAIHKIFT